MLLRGEKETVENINFLLGPLHGQKRVVDALMGMEKMENAFEGRES